VKKREGTDVLKVDIKYSKTTQKETKREYKFSKTHQTTNVKFYDYNPYEDVKNLLVDVPIDNIANNSYSLNYAEYMKDKTEEEQYEEGIVVKTLGEIFGEKTNNYINVDDNIKYNVIGLSSKGYSKVTKEIFGSGLKIKRQQLCESSQFCLSKILNGCYGYINQNTIGGIISSEYWLFDINTDVISNEYLYYIFEQQILSQLTKISNGVGIPRINQENFYKLKIPIPTLERQHEMVKYLDFIYEKANKTSNEKITELKQLNAFCLNNQKRFGENVVKTLGEICDINYGTRIVKRNNIEGEYPVYGSGRAMFSTETFNREGFNILIGRFALSLQCVRIVNDKIFLNDSGLSIKPKTDILLHKYISYYLIHNQDIIYNCARGTAQKNLEMDIFKSIKIPIPTLERQKEIVEYCEYNDILIKQLEKEIENNKNQAQQFLTGIVKAQVNTVLDKD
jgi:restriction endonuclease S subunit